MFDRLQGNAGVLSTEDIDKDYGHCLRETRDSSSDSK